MKTGLIASLALGFLLMTGVAAADLAKARLLYESRLFDDAKRELIAVASSATSAVEKAAALHLLGTIAVEEERYESAIRIWEDLVARFPETQDARDVQGKIPLARDLAQKSTPLEAPQPQSSTGGAPLAGVIVAGSGTETQFVDQTVTEVMNFLASAGVEVSRAPQGLVAVPELTRLATSSGAKSVLFLALRFGYIENLRAECYSAEGRLLWEEKAAGSFGATKAGVTEGLINRIKQKLQEHVGDACLPHHAQTAVGR